MTARVYKALTMVLLLALAGCANSFHHRKVALAPALPPEPPELSQSPLYSPEMSENNPRLPSLPPAVMRQVVAAPQPAPQKPRITHKPKTPASMAKTSDADSSSTTTGMPVAAASGDAASQPTEKKAAEPQAHLAGPPASSPIGELTAGDSASTAQTSRQAEDLIKNTQDGVDKIKRSLSPDEKKTLAEIGAFLKKAQQALANGDVDGAYGLATKAKLLLDEVTQQ
jgi:hypothetical protein